MLAAGVYVNAIYDKIKSTIDGMLVELKARTKGMSRSEYFDARNLLFAIQ